jgi:hypothetical protein
MMCTKQHASLEEALACRDKERHEQESSVERALRKAQETDLALYAIVRAKKNAVREQKMSILLEEELWKAAEKALSDD